MVETKTVTIRPLLENVPTTVMNLEASVKPSLNVSELSKKCEISVENSVPNLRFSSVLKLAKLNSSGAKSAKRIGNSASTQRNNSTQVLALEKSKHILKLAKESANDSLTFATEALHSVRLSNKLHAPENTTFITPRESVTPRSSLQTGEN